MPEAVLTLRLNPHTGERTLVINYESDADAMPFEHEDEHRSFVEQLLGRPIAEIAEHLEVKRSPPHPLMVDKKELDEQANTQELQSNEQQRPKSTVTNT